MFYAGRVSSPNFAAKESVELYPSDLLLSIRFASAVWTKRLLSRELFRYNSGMRKVCVLVSRAMADMAQDPDKVYSAIRENNLTQLKTLLDQKGSASVADSRG